MDNEICMMSAVDLIAAYGRRDLSPVDVIKATIDRIETLNPILNAFHTFDPKTALSEASESERRWMRREPIGGLDGIPSSIKDTFYAKGLVSVRASYSMPSKPATEDAPAIARMRSAGAIFLGQSNVPEFGYKGTTDSLMHGITRNPWNTSRTSGGSSGGASAAVASGMSVLAAGSDGAGSIRIPASFCGLFGIKPTVGRVANYPTGPFGNLVHIGPITRTVADGALLLDLMSTPDARDPYCSTSPLNTYATLGKDISTLRIGYSPSLGFGKVDPDVSQAIAKAAEIFRDIGAHVELVEIDITESSEIFKSLYFSAAQYILDGIDPALRSKIDHGFVEMAAEGAAISKRGLQAAMIARAVFTTRVRRFFESYDLLLSPTLPLTAFEAGQSWPGGRECRHWLDWSPFTYPFNLSGHPAATIPCGRDRGGLPIGLQVTGQLHADDVVMRACAAFERVIPIELPATPTTVAESVS